MKSEHMREEATAKEARQGDPGKPIAYLLMASMVLGAIGWLGLELYFNTNEPAVTGYAVEQTDTVTQ